LCAHPRCPPPPRTRRPAAAKRDAGARAAGGAPVEGAADATNFAHYADEGEGMSLSPATVLTMSLVFIGIVVLLHVFGKLAK
jgi:preprotein translocase subunit Sec61beta